ncbi:MAG: hypothetical protein AAF289_19760 [Cyanobacteria bacterium P01_A01_bin.135]
MTQLLSSPITITLEMTDPELNDDSRDQQIQYLVQELQHMDIDSARRVVDPDPPEGNKALGGFIVGLLTAEVSLENIQYVFRFLSDRLGGKPITLEVEANGKRLKVTANNQAELANAILAAQEFIAV